MERKAVSGIMLTLILTSMLTVAFNIPVLTHASPDPDWLNGWSYRKSHVIHGASGAGTDYQIKIETHYGSGTDNGQNVYLNYNCRTDFGDVRFTDDNGTTELDYWMQEKVDGYYAIFWVEVADDLSSNNQTIYIYYGNSSVSTTSNGTNTFIFFDDFSGPSLDTNKWDLLQGDVGIANSSLEITGTTGTRGSIRTNQTFSPGVALHSKAKGNDTNQVTQRWHHMNVGSGQNISSLETYGWHFDNQIRYTTRNSDVNLEQTVVTIPDFTTWNLFETRWTSGEAEYLVDEEVKATHTNYVPTTDLHIMFTEGKVDCGTVYTDWIFLRKFTDPEPTPVRSTIFSQNFDEEPTGSVPQGWTVENPDICSLTVNETIHYGDSGKSARYVDSASRKPNGSSYVGRTFEAPFTGQNSILIAEFSMMAEVPSYFSLYIDDGIVKYHGVNIYFTPYGKLAYYDDSGWHYLRPFSNDTWVRIKMVIDIPKNTYDIYVDGVLEAEGAHFRGFGTVTQLSRILFGGNSFEMPIGYIDEISLYERASNVRVYVDQSLGYIPGVPVGDSFTVDMVIEVSNITDFSSEGIVGWGLNLKVDPTVLNITGAVGATSGYFLWEFADSWSEPYPIQLSNINATAGLADVTEQIIPSPVGGAGDPWSGLKLVTLVFTSKSEIAYSLIDLVNVEYMTPDGMWHPVDEVVDGYYNPPPPPDLSVEGIMLPYISMVPLIYPTPDPEFAYKINATVTNEGTADAGSFNVSFSVYLNEIEVPEYGRKKPISGLAHGASETVWFDFSPENYGNYTLIIEADCDNDVVELDETNNVKMAWVKGTVRGDVDGDGDVDWVDFGIFVADYGKTFEHPPYPSTDFDYDGDVDWYDFGIFAQNFGRTV